MAHRALQLAAIVLFAVGALGFFTYADDLRHIGEVAAASGFVLAGASLFASGFRSTRHLRWFAIAVLVGMLLGLALDSVAWGLAAGVAAGALVTWWHHVRAEST